MEKNIDQLKQELVQEIKDLANEIAKSNSYVGLLSNEIKFRALQEKFINLKFLDRKHIGLDIFDNPIPVKEEVLEQENTIIQEEFTIQAEESPKKEQKISVLTPKENIVLDNPEETTKKIDTPYTDAEYDFTGLVSEKKYPKIQIDFNDGIAFVNQLFDGDSQKMDDAIYQLNQKSTISDSKALLTEFIQKNNWKGKEEYLDRLKELIIKRFD